MRLSVKLGALCAAAALLPLLLVWLAVSYLISSDARARAIGQLQSDSRAASAIYQKRLVELRLACARLADEIARRATVSNATVESDSGAALARLQDLLPRAQHELSLDFIIVADPQGKVIARHNNRPSPAESLTGAEYKNPVAERVISEIGRSHVAPFASTVLEPADQLARLDLSMLARVPREDGSAVEQALVIEAGAPIVAQGRAVGLVLIGQMLNTYYAARATASPLQTPVVAEVRQVLYRNEGRHSGAAVALGDTIVASSVPGDEGATEPALKGARCDASRGEEIIREGGRAYVVAWQPLKSPDESAVGAIGAALPESDLEGPSGTLRAVFIAGAVLGLLGGLGGFLAGRRMGERLERLAQAASRMSVGELGAPIRDLESGAAPAIRAFLARDEIARLAEQLELMRESFRQAIERLRRR